MWQPQVAQFMAESGFLVGVSVGLRVDVDLELGQARSNGCRRKVAAQQAAGYVGGIRGIRRAGTGGAQSGENPMQQLVDQGARQGFDTLALGGRERREPCAMTFEFAVAKLLHADADFLDCRHQVEPVHPAHE